MTWQQDLFDSIKNDVITLTNRPDLANETLVAVRTATLTVHLSNVWPRDTVTVDVPDPSSLSQFAIDTTSLLPGLRGVRSVRTKDTNGDPCEFPEISVVELDDLRDSIYRNFKDNIAWIAGTNLNIRTSAPGVGYFVEYVKLPLVTRDTYNSWIAQSSPDAIVYVAASVVFSTNGNEEKAKSYMNTYQNMLLPNLVSNFLTSEQR